MTDRTRRWRPRGPRYAGLLVGCLALAGALGSTPARGLDLTRFMAVDEVRPGMVGYGLTTFADTTISRFTIEVLGVLAGWIPGGDLIVIEAAGGPIAETGIYRGMSGSPIYVDGRLLGALSYNLGSFGERAIGGVTPIAEMLPMLDETGEATGGGRSGGEPGRDRRSHAPSPEGSRVRLGQWDGLDEPATIRPIGTPVVLSGVDPRARRLMDDLFADLGCSAVAGGGAGGGAHGARLEPGAPVGVQIVRGDAEATALGTVTLVDDGRVLAFGHPMMQAGIVDMPMTSARILTVYPSQAISFVIGTAAETRGRLVADRQTGVMGVVGEEAAMVPLEIELTDAQRRTRRFEFEIVESKFLLTQFVGFMAFNAFLASESSFGDVTLDLHVEVAFGDGTLLEVDDVVASFTGPQSLAQQVSQPLAGILLSGIEEVSVERVAVRMRLSPEVRLAVIDEIVVDRSRLRAGETLAATVFLRRFEQEREAVHLEVPIPASLHPGPTLLRICSAGAAQEWEQERAPRRFVPQTLAQYVELYEQGASSNVMRLTLHTDALGVVVDGREMMALPSSVFRIMDTDKRRGGRSGSWGRLVHEQAVETDYQLSGCQELALEVTAPSVTVAPRPGQWEVVR